MSYLLAWIVLGFIAVAIFGLSGFLRNRRKEAIGKAKSELSEAEKRQEAAAKDVAKAAASLQRATEAKGEIEHEIQKAEQVRAEALDRGDDTGALDAELERARLAAEAARKARGE